uniref:Uncharacterized protein n=1 Tax=Anguilla anguilla TaxID=7936 RepID=A0A0E9VER9_ANGAN
MMALSRDAVEIQYKNTSLPIMHSRSKACRFL